MIEAEISDRTAYARVKGPKEHSIFKGATPSSLLLEQQVLEIRRQEGRLKKWRCQIVENLAYQAEKF